MELFLILYILFISAVFLKVLLVKAPLHTITEDLSVIIPFRNEEVSLPFLLDSIAQLKCESNYELIFVNDHSTDKSVEIIEKQKSNLRIKLFHLKDGVGKKKALAKGFAESNFKRIVQVDADVTFNSDFLKTQSTHFDYSSGYVKLEGDNDHLHDFQKWESLATMFVTKLTYAISVPLMSNGANSCYQKNEDLILNDKYTSGDDIFLLYSFVNKGKQTGFNDRSIVNSSAARSFKDFWNQRLRWIGKTGGVSNFSFRFLSLVFLLAQLSPLLLYFYYSQSLMTLLIIKTVIELLGMLHVNKRMKYKGLAKSYFIMILIYPFYLIFLLLSSLFMDSTWKGRKV